MSIVFANLILFQSFQISFEDLVKVDDLLEHASYHQEMYGDTFFEFLDEHYSENFSNHNENHEEHENLPFKHDSKNCHQTISIFTLNFSNFEISLNQEIDSNMHFFYKDLYAFLNKSTIFQPPKNS